MSSPKSYSTLLFGGIILLIISVNSVLPVSGQEDDISSLQDVSLIGHDPRLFYGGGSATPRIIPMIRRQQNAPRITRGRSPYYSQQIVGRLPGGLRTNQANFLPDRSANRPQDGLYWMRQQQSAATEPIVPRGPAGMRMLSEWNADLQAANRPLPPLWSLLQAPRRNRSRRDDHLYYEE